MLREPNKDHEQLQLQDELKLEAEAEYDLWQYDQWQYGQDIQGEISRKSDAQDYECNEESLLISSYGG